MSQWELNIIHQWWARVSPSVSRLRWEQWHQLQCKAHFEGPQTSPQRSRRTRGLVEGKNFSHHLQGNLTWKKNYFCLTWKTMVSGGTCTSFTGKNDSFPSINHSFPSINHGFDGENLLVSAGIWPPFNPLGDRSSIRADEGMKEYSSWKQQHGTFLWDYMMYGISSKNSPICIYIYIYI